MKKNIKKNFIGDRGSALVMALVVVSFIAVLGMTITTMALSSYKIKAMEGRVKKAFYNADMAVDEIYAGMCRDSYTELGNAYEYVVSNLLEVDATFVSMIDNTQANAILRRKYFENACYSILGSSFTFSEDTAIKTAIKNAIAIGGEISDINTDKLAANLKNYLSPNYRDTSSSDITLDVTVGGIPYVTVLGTMVQSITVKDVTVTYQNEATDYFSQVTTDYEIVFPENAIIDMVEDTGSILMSFKDYAFASNMTVNNGAYVNVNGGIYGYRGINCKGYPSASTPVRLTVSGGNVVTTGNIILENNAALDFNNGRIWADNVEIKGGELDIRNGGAAYVADDLTFTTPDVDTIKNKAVISGDYYGYSIEGYGVTASEATPAKSSAMVVNSKNTTIDLSGIKTLVLGGYGWVEYNEGAHEYYRTGESIAIRYTQMAYILPTSWGGVVNSNFFGRNLLGSPAVIRNEISPGDVAYYYNFSSGDNAAKFYRALYDDTLFNSLCAGIPGIDMTEAQNIRADIRTILDSAYRQFLNGNGGGPAVQINEHARVYEKGIIRDTDSHVNDYNGVGDELVKILYANSVWRSKLVGSLLIELSDDWIYEASQWTPVTKHGPINYGSMKYSYKIKSEDELGRGAVENILKGKDKINGNYYYYVEDAHGNNANDYMVYVADGDFELSSYFPCRKGIIIASGNVKAGADFEGCILALGEINVTGGSYTANPTLIETILKNVPGVRGYFDGVSDVTVGRHVGYNDGTHAPGSGDEDPGDLNTYGADDCVNIANYRKNAVTTAP